ncbi:MAG: molybdate ABC transporter substrate-binding protein [Halioglobus sp.]|nr:molybdate ABC transporter substrate-binding protein [Halioglobus sp.]
MRILTVLLLLLASPLSIGESISIAVAANFKPTLEKITEPFLANTNIFVTFSAASTGVLATQILHGAQYDMFFAADEETPQKVVSAKALASTDAFCYARGSLVLAGGKDGLSSLAQPGLSLAIANPATAPYGRAAMEVLARPEFSAGEGRKLVKGNSVAQALQFWQSGAVDMALLPRALKAAGATPVPLDWYQPVAQYAVVLTHSPAVDEYLQWLRSDTVRDLIKDAGYEPCP